MKKGNVSLLKVFTATAVLASFIFSNCKEEPIEIASNSLKTRKVLVEELTGVGCVACPGGAKQLQQLKSFYGDNLVIAAIHASDPGNFNKPLPGSKYKFNTSELEDLVKYIGETAGMPAIAVCRELDELNGDIFRFSPWGGAVDRSFSNDYNLKISLENNFDPTTRHLTTEIEIAPETDLPGDHNLTLYLIEDEIVDWQNVGGTFVSDYVHRHVLRKVLTDVRGDKIEEALKGGAVLKKTYTYVVPADFEEKNLSVIAFVHHPGIPDREVLQVEEKHVF